MSSEGRIRDDLGTINQWLCRTRLRAVALVFAIAVALKADGAPIDLLSASGVLGALALFSIWALSQRGRPRSKLGFFYAQHVVDLLAITIGLAAAVGGGYALLFRMLYVLVVVPASLVSIPSGLFAATGATIGHEVLLGWSEGFSWTTASGFESIAPAFLFFLVAQQCFFYGAHLEQKNQTLASLAERLDDSRQGLAELVGIARVLNSTIDSPAVVAHVNRLARERLGGDWSATVLVDLSRNAFRVAASEHVGGSGGRSVGIDVPLEAWPALRRLSPERRVLQLDGDVEQIPESLREGQPPECVLLAGLFRDDLLVGALAVGPGRTLSDGETATALQRLVDIAEHSTIALRNAQLLEEAREASALKSEFVSTMSHELRTPLNVILGYAEILRDEAADTPTEVRELLDRIGTCGRDLLELVDATLQVGRLEAGAIKIQMQEVGLAELMDGFVASSAGLPRAPNVDLSWDRGVDPAATIRTDPAKAALIVRNLLSNALKFTRSGTVGVSIRGRESTLEIEVRDTGAGISPEQLPTIFEMFRQVGAPSEAGPHGVGLGLYIVDQLVRRLGGTITVRSELGVGTAFVVCLPELRAPHRPWADVWPRARQGTEGWPSR